MNSKQKYKNIDEDIDIDTGTKKYWRILCLFVFIAVGLSVSVTVMPNWRIAQPINYTYVYRDKKQTRRFGEVLYGLYKINFDGGSYIATWSKRVEACKASMLSIPEGGSGAGGMIQAKLCPTECESGIKTRYNAYKRIQIISIALLAVLVVSDVLAVAGIALYFCLNSYALIYLSLWAAAGALCLGTGVYWIWETNDAFWLICSTQQMPYPSVGFCWYIFVGGSATYLFAALVAYFLYNFDQSVELKLINDSLYTATINHSSMYPQMPINPYPTPPMNMQMGLYSQMGAPPPQNVYLRSNPSSMPVMNKVSMMGRGVPTGGNPRMLMMPYMMPGDHNLPQMMPGDPRLPHMMPSKAAMSQVQRGHAPNFNF